MTGCWAEEDDSVLLKLPSLFTRHQLTSSAPVSSSGNYQHLGQRRNLTRGENPPKPRTLHQLQTQRIRYKRPAASLCLAATEQFLLQPVSSARLRGRCWRWGRHPPPLSCLSMGVITAITRIHATGTGYVTCWGHASLWSTGVGGCHDRRLARCDGSR